MSGATTAAAIVGASVVGGIAQSYSANQAASAQRNAAAQATAAQQGYFNIANQNLQPFIQTGTAATNKLQQLEGLNGGSPSTIMATLEGLPGYQFANYQGLKSVQNSATSRGLGVSGAALKGAANYSTGLANQYYNNLLGGIQNTATMGANAASGLAGNAIQTGSNIGSNITGAGQATAASDIAGGAAIGNIASSVPNALITQNLLSNIQNQNLASQYAQNSAYNAGTFDNAAASNGFPWSDIRLKENIIPMGQENGYPIYEFSYKGNSDRFIGVMAQDIIGIIPRAVHKIGKYFAVDYSMLGVKFRKI